MEAAPGNKLLLTNSRQAAELRPDWWNKTLSARGQHWLTMSASVKIAATKWGSGLCEQPAQALLIHSHCGMPCALQLPPLLLGPPAGPQAVHATQHRAGQPCCAALKINKRAWSASTSQGYVHQMSTPNIARHAR